MHINASGDCPRDKLISHISNARGKPVIAIAVHVANKGTIAG